MHGESLLSSILQSPNGTGSASQVQVGSGSGQQKVQGPSGSGVPSQARFVPTCDEFECFPLDEQLEVWWAQQHAPNQGSPECPANRTNPFEVTPGPGSEPEPSSALPLRLTCVCAGERRTAGGDVRENRGPGQSDPTGPPLCGAVTRTRSRPGRTTR